MSTLSSPEQAQGALEALRELRQRIEGFVPFEQAGAVHDLFTAALTAMQDAVLPSGPGTGGAAPGGAASFQVALAAVQELRLRMEGAIPAGQADYLGALFDTVLDPLQALVQVQGRAG